MACHVAILRMPYVRAVLAGRKTVESRLSKSAMEPYGYVTEGDRIFIKASGGPFMATAVAGRVAGFENLRPSDVATLRKHFDAGVCGDDDYWRMKRDARYATFVELRAVEACDVGPRYAKSAYKAWFTLPDEASPWLEVVLTAGAVRNRYVSVGGGGAFFGAGEFTLALPDGQALATGLYRGQRVRWRGWGPYFEAHEVTAGDRVRFVAVGGGRYRVEFVKGGGDGDA